MPTKKTATKPVKPARDRSGALYAVVGDDVIARLDGWLEKLNAAGTGPKWARQDLVRAALVRALDERGAKGEAP